ncbi:hypothetical protein L6452_08868 [Arctium lappa]|uniref:Uncharacterized protein n=1 Tax=Arctium lappa TaxID=4217 RepID=A0ACB9DIX0_ARCLA|nr:hypothetical protein L6452_08868 [Arctium lappa]
MEVQRRRLELYFLRGTGAVVVDVVIISSNMIFIRSSEKTLRSFGDAVGVGLEVVVFSDCAVRISSLVVQRCSDS